MYKPQHGMLLGRWFSWIKGTCYIKFLEPIRCHHAILQVQKNVPFYTLPQFILIPEVAIVLLGICKVDFNTTVKNFKQNCVTWSAIKS